MQIFDGFDAVFSMATFEFIKDYHAAFEELYRVVKPGGRFLIGTIAKSGAWGKLYQEMAMQGEKKGIANTLSQKLIFGLYSF